ncbi:DUF5677 domain-containing protein [Halalkalicoccus salilacus]|uniref:DUF5677 domain-containing protein n=1 Tax=Halalkalicoccus TaxID=332246 RepID=UPI002F961FC2
MNRALLALYTTKLIGKLFAETSKTNPYNSLNYRRRKHQKFQQQNHQQWQKGIDLLEQFITLNQEAAEDFIERYTEQRDDIDQEKQFQAVLLLHARAIQTSNEILTQIKNGYTDGAYARWRNLYETAATALFIKDHPDTGERFLDYRTIEDYYRAKTQEEYEYKLQINTISGEEMQILKDNRQKLREKHGKSFDDGGYGYGWANNHFDRATFPKIAEETELDHLKPYYELTHKLIHSGATSATYSMGILQDFNAHTNQNMLEKYRLLSIQSSYGFTDAAQLTAISLAQITTALLNLEPTMLRLIKLQALQELISDIQQEFLDTQREIERQAAIEK